MEDGHGGTFVLGAGDFEIMARRGRLPFRRGESAAVLSDARARDQVVVSETFAERYRLKEGDEVVLRPPGGMVRLRIAGVYYDYTTEGGLAVMDRALFQRFWQDPWVNSVVIYLTPGADAEAVRQAVRDGSRPERPPHPLQARPRARILEVFDQTFAITYGLEAIALIVAVLGVLTTLVASVLERTREIGILRSLGFDRAASARTVLGGGIARHPREPRRDPGRPRIVPHPDPRDQQTVVRLDDPVRLPRTIDGANMPPSR